MPDVCRVILARLGRDPEKRVSADPPVLPAKGIVTDWPGLQAR